MSKSGWSLSEVFQNYLTRHFAQYARITLGTTEPTLVLFDGHRSHISLTLTKWIKAHNVILFVLPPHTSHLTQPLDVSVFGPFKAMYNKECQTYMKNNPGLTITKYQVAELTSRPYMKSLTPENLTAAFRKTGIYPFDSQVISDSQVAPAVIYQSQQTEQPDAKSYETNPPEDTLHVQDHGELSQSSPDLHEPSQPTHGLHEVTQSALDQDPPETTCKHDTNATFFQQRTITSAVKNRTKRKFVPPFLTGNLLKKSVTDILHEQATKKKLLLAKPKSSKHEKAPKKKQPSSTKTQSNTIKTSKIVIVDESRPSTSGLNKTGGPIELFSNEDISTCSSDDISESEEDKCCVCNAFQPEEVRKCHSIIFVKWAKCDYCTHWTHLQFCSYVRVIRMGSEFRCPHCLSHTQ